MIDVETEIRSLAQQRLPEPTPVQAIVARGSGLRARRRAVFTVAVLAAACLVATVGVAASSTPSAGWPTPDDPIFDGLPRTVVVEVLANPRAQDDVRILTPVAPGARNSMWQGMVINFVQCRQLLVVYRTWSVTGRPGVLAPHPVPGYPQEPSYRDVQVIDRFYRAAIASGDKARLRSDLLNESGCGVWVPATPGDAGGATIADVVRSLG